MGSPLRKHVAVAESLSFAVAFEAEVENTEFHFQ
jgi:hypothetical protein